MLLGVQRFDVEEVGIHRRSWSIDADGLWIRVVRHEGMGSDEQLVRLLGHGRAPVARSLVGLTLAGRSVQRLAAGGAHECEPGSLALLPGRASFSTRGDVSDGPSLSMTIELDREVWGGSSTPPSFGRLGDLPRARRLVEALCEAIEHAWKDAGARSKVDAALLEALACLRAEGLPLPDVDPRSFAQPAAALARLGRAIDLALSRTRSRAMLVDVEQEGAISARTLQRALPALCARWGQTPESFREHTRRNVLARATWAMTNPKATTELIGRAVGFSTPNAFCRAMASYGLPSPGRVRERFRACA